MIHIMAIVALAAVPAVPVTDASWASIKATGGADLGHAYVDAGQWYLPTGISLAGVQPGATTLNFGATCASVKVSHNSSTIYVTAVTVPVPGQAACPAAKLGKIKTGTYSVVYRGPKEPDQLLGQVTLGD